MAKVLKSAGGQRPKEVSFPEPSLGDPLSYGKRRLFLTLGEGRAIRPCPGTKKYLCCGYKILFLGSGCPFDCTYCILQSYLNNPFLTIFANAEQIIDQAAEEIRAQKDVFFRIGTGEFMDSLGLEPLVNLAPYLIRTFSGLTNACLELKTKSIFVDHLLDLPHRRRTFLAWSLNSPQVARTEDKGAPEIKERLLAAAKAALAGYPLCFHFDPLIYYPGWERGYRETISWMGKYIPSESVVWISLGALRFMPPLKGLAQRRHPETKIFLGEFILGLDGKMRYLRPIRVEMYQKIYAWLKETFPQTAVYLCMESELVWKEALGFSPSEHGGLARMLDKAAQRAVNA